jgi:hypothetical protein
MPGTRGTRPSETKRPSTLLDTRVVDCGDNLEQQGQMRGKGTEYQTCAFSGSTFILQPLALPARHYVKIMLDQILGENSFQSKIVY